MGFQERYELTCPVFLIGFMGAGKTTLARRLARECGLASVDIDRVLERRYGRDAKTLLLQEGQERFAEMEAQELEQYASGDPLIIACGGSLVAGERSREIIASKGFAVYVHVLPEESSARISNHNSRPFFETLDSVRRINRELLPYYEQLADATVDSNGKTSSTMAYEVKKLLKERGVLCPVSK